MQVQILATYEHSQFIELVIDKLQEEDIHDIFAIPLQSRTQEKNLQELMHGSGEGTVLDLGMILAFMGGTTGAARGYIMEWGPVYCGLIGAFAGFALGFIIQILITKFKRKRFKRHTNKMSEVILILKCPSQKMMHVEQILWEYHALGVAKTKISAN
ncbi:hypothetical protein [Paenibacillus sp. SN-8-1]|uniref:hypothetical protein n=1 Tax=Paenibacillus sp. SN-8-1 TaxID=3435409 RepID=UPI003D9A5260